MSSRPSRFTSPKVTPQHMLSPTEVGQANTSREPGGSSNLPCPSFNSSTLPPPLEARKKSGQPSLLTSAAATPSPGIPAGRPTDCDASSNFSLPRLRNSRELLVG